MGKQENSKERSNRVSIRNEMIQNKNCTKEAAMRMTIAPEYELYSERRAQRKVGEDGERYGVDCNQITSYNKMFNIIMKCNAYEI